VLRARGEEGRERLQRQLDRKTDLLEVAVDGLRERRVVRVVAIAGLEPQRRELLAVLLEDAVGALLPAGLGQQRNRLVHVVLELADRLVAERPSDRRVGDGRVAAV